MSAIIYIVAKHTPGERSGYGAVIDHNGISNLEHSGQPHETAARLLLKGTLAALEAIPLAMPVLVVSADEYLCRWTVPRLAMLERNGFRNSNRKPAAHGDLLRSLAVHAAHKEEAGASLMGKTVPEDQWCDHHRRAQAIAVMLGGGGVIPKKVKPAGFYGAALMAMQEPTMATEVAGVLVRDYGEAKDAPWA